MFLCSILTLYQFLYKKDPECESTIDAYLGGQPVLPTRLMAHTGLDRMVQKCTGNSISIQTMRTCGPHC